MPSIIELVEAQGNLVEVQGNLVEVQGKLVEAQGKLVEAQGKLVEAHDKIILLETRIHELETENNCINLVLASQRPVKGPSNIGFFVGPGSRLVAQSLLRR